MSTHDINTNYLSMCASPSGQGKLHSVSSRVSTDDFYSNQCSKLMGGGAVSIPWLLTETMITEKFNWWDEFTIMTMITSVEVSIMYSIFPMYVWQKIEFEFDVIMLHMWLQSVSRG